MTIADWLFESMKKLGQAGVDSPRRDALVLLEDVLQKDRTWILARPDENLKPETIKEVNKLIKRRIAREPLAYIRNKAWFYGRFFDVSPEVLIPRPETENFVELATKSTKKKSPKVIDIGCGSGVIGITLKLENPEWQVELCDISEEALEIAKKNVDKYNLDIKVFKSDLMSAITSKYDVIVANLPYVPENLISSPEIEKEPAIALFSGLDGLDLYRKFWNEIKIKKVKPDHIIIESLESQHMVVAGIARDSGYNLIETSGLVQSYDLGK